MGEIADMMLDGTLCVGCGVFLEENHRPTGKKDKEGRDIVEAIEEGYPIYCPDCGGE